MRPEPVELGTPDQAAHAAIAPFDEDFQEIQSLFRLAVLSQKTDDRTQDGHRSKPPSPRLSRIRTDRPGSNRFPSYSAAPAAILPAVPRSMSRRSPLKASRPRTASIPIAPSQLTTLTKSATLRPGH